MGGKEEYTCILIKLLRQSFSVVRKGNILVLSAYLYPMYHGYVTLLKPVLLQLTLSIYITYLVRTRLLCDQSVHFIILQHDVDDVDDDVYSTSTLCM